MFAFFDYVVQFLYSIIAWLGSIIHGALSSIVILATAIPLVLQLTGYVPFFLSAAIFITLCVFVLNYILFHGNQ